MVQVPQSAASIALPERRRHPIPDLLERIEISIKTAT